VYQYTSFALWRNKTQGKTEEEKAILAESGQVRTVQDLGLLDERVEHIQDRVARPDLSELNTLSESAAQDPAGDP
jgi:hypothetical protein